MAKPKISTRKPPPPVPLEAAAAFVQGQHPPSKAKGKRGKTSGPSGLQKSRSPNVYLPERKRGWLKGAAPRRCTMYLPQDVFQTLRQRCFEAGVEMSAFVTEAVREALERLG